MTTTNSCTERVRNEAESSNRGLEEDGLVKRSVKGSAPPQVSYSLTAKGETIAPVVRSLVKWGLANSGDHISGEFGMAPFYSSAVR